MLPELIVSLNTEANQLLGCGCLPTYWLLKCSDWWLPVAIKRLHGCI